jgi:hypothetical protein
MNIKEIAVMIAQGLLFLFFIYLIGLGIQAPELIENFENDEGRRISPQKLGKYFEEINDNLKDDMNLDKHRGAYQDALSQIQENVNLAMLQTLSTGKGTIPKDETIDKFHKLHRFKGAVSELEEFLDGVKT